MKKQTRKIILIVLVSILSVVIIGVCSFTGYMYLKADAAIEKIAAPKSEVKLKSVLKTNVVPEVTEEVQPVEVKKANAFTFVLAGVDNREGSGGTMNSDVLMFGSLNMDTKLSTLVSIPRDVQLKPAELEARKINYYYAHYYAKDKDTAISNTKSFFSELLDLPLDYMIVIDFDGLRKIVDALGGLDIDVDMNMRYVDTADGTNINLKKGLQHLNGKQALDFVRYRKSNMGTDESSDIARNGRQQQVLSGMLNEMTSLGGITQWGNILEIIGDHVKTDIPADQLRSWILHFSDIKPQEIRTMPLTSRWDNPYIYLMENDVSVAFNALRTQAGLTSDLTMNPADIMSTYPGEPAPEIEIPPDFIREHYMH
ncbi:LCP family protein [Paenibacillus psychroresistens]|nr:LCP family protein [Paenibacillus psychroresistens]